MMIQLTQSHTIIIRFHYPNAIKRFHQGWGLKGSDVRNLTLVNDKEAILIDLGSKRRVQLHIYKKCILLKQVAKHLKMMIILVT